MEMNIETVEELRAAIRQADVVRLALPFVTRTAKCFIPIDPQYVLDFLADYRPTDGRLQLGAPLGVRTDEGTVDVGAEVLDLQ